jgi:hypothetical protein
MTPERMTSETRAPPHTRRKQAVGYESHVAFKRRASGWKRWRDWILRCTRDSSMSSGSGHAQNVDSVQRCVSCTPPFLSDLLRCRDRRPRARNRLVQGINCRTLVAEWY